MFLECSCFTMLLVFAVQQNESAVSMPISPRVLDFLPIWSPQSSDQFPVLYSRFSLVIYFIHSINGVYAIFIILMLPLLHLFSILISCHKSLWSKVFSRHTGGEINNKEIELVFFYDICRDHSSMTGFWIDLQLTRIWLLYCINPLKNSAFRLWFCQMQCVVSNVIFRQLVIRQCVHKTSICAIWNMSHKNVCICIG